MHITIYDYLLLPVYLYIFYIIVKKKSLKYEDPELRKHYLNSFYLRMAGAIGYSMLVQYYYGYGDSFTYHSGSDFLHEQISKNLNNIKYLFSSPEQVKQFYDQEVGDIEMSGYFGIGSGLSVMKIATIISFFSFNKFLIISLFFGLFSFIGQWKLFLVFNDINKNKHQRLLAFAVLYTPSIWFWGSGLLKDSICIGATGFIVFILYNNLLKNKLTLKSILFLLINIYIVFNIKSYIIIILAISFITTLFLRSLNAIKNIIFKFFIISTFFLITVIVAFFLNFDSQINDLVEESQVQVQTYQKNYRALQEEDQSSRASIEMAQLDGSISSILSYSPIAIFNCLFRPFLWESKKIIIFFTSLESTALLLFTLYLLFKTRFIGFFKIIITNDYYFFSFIASLLFALIIGFTTYNFGTMIRYKIILLPFYYFMLVGIYSKLAIPKTSENKG